MRKIVLSLAILATTAMMGAAHADEALVKKGEYIARASDCTACHTTNPDKPFAGGYAVNTPFGNVYSSNISSSKTFGIGNWTEQEFAKAVREGVNKDNQRLYPAMPYDSYHDMRDEDVAALYAYFQTVKPIDEAAPKTSLIFPFNVRQLMLGWNIVNMPSAKKDVYAGDDELTRGSYLVNVLGHCGTCHTPRNFMMGMDKFKLFAGSSTGTWYAPNITSDNNAGIGTWSEQDIASYVHTGQAVNKGYAAGDMAAAIQNSTQYLSDADIQAISKYLKTVPAISDNVQTKPRSSFGNVAEHAYDMNNPVSKQLFIDVDANAHSAASDQTVIVYNSNAAEGDKGHDQVLPKSPNMTDLSGVTLYDSACASCHQPTGTGVVGQFYPSLSNNSTVGAVNPDNLVMVILEGIHRQAGDQTSVMPAYAKDMSDAEIASVANYVLSQWGNTDVKVTADKVTKLRAGHPNVSIAPILFLFWGGVVIGLIVVLFILYMIFGRRNKATGS